MASFQTVILALGMLPPCVQVCNLHSSSGSNHLNCGVDRVDPLKLDAGCGCCKAPVGLGVFGISPAQPGCHLLLQSLRVGDAPVEALRTQNSQLRLRHVEPAAMLGRIVPLCAAENYGGRSDDLTT